MATFKVEAILEKSLTKLLTIYLNLSLCFSFLKTSNFFFTYKSLLSLFFCFPLLLNLFYTFQGSVLVLHLDKIRVYLTSKGRIIILVYYNMEVKSNPKFFFI